jgi:DNA-binding transcriptional LysR family regulator
MADLTDLNDIAVFVRVAQSGSFSGAARALGMPLSTVSRKVTALEERLGVTLIQRTTRKLSLTSQGRAYFDECCEPLGHLLDAERALVQAQRAPEGSLRISGPVLLGQDPFYLFMSAFLKDHPRIHADVFLTNAYVDLIAENVDIAIRFGRMQDSSLIAQLLGSSVRYLVASPAYLRGLSLPERPQDLADHRCVVINGRNNEAEWQLVNGRRSAKVRVRGPVSARDFHAVSAFTHQGLGIGFLPYNYCEAGLASGELVRVLPEWSSPEIPVHAVYPTRRFLPSKLVAFLDYLKAWKEPLWMPA